MSHELLILATDDGVRTGRVGADGRQPQHHGLVGQTVTSVVAPAGALLAGTRDGVWRSADAGATWTAASDGLTQRYVRWLGMHPDVPGRIFAGTEPAALFVTEDGGAQWRECPRPTALRDAHGWWLPYSSGAGCVRGFAFHGARGYAAVEVGGLLRSDDGGLTWELAPGSDGRPTFGAIAAGLVHPDVHSVAVHPSSADHVVTPTGGGLYRSTDGGARWEQVTGGYVRAVWLDPDDAGRMVAGSADNSSGRNGDIRLTEDGGRRWRSVAHGLPTPWSRCMVERFHAAGPTLLAVLSDGRLLSATIGEWQWQRLAPDAGRINAVRQMAG